MKLATYQAKGRETWGFIVEHPERKEAWLFPPQQSCDIIRKSAQNATNGMFKSLPDFEPAGGWPETLTAFLELEEAGMETLRALERYVCRFIEQADAFALETVGTRLADAQLCAPIPRPRLMWGLVQNCPSFWRKDPDRRIANFFPQGHQRPIGSIVADHGIFKTATGFNVELGFVIGKKGRDIPIEKAMEYVAGYTVILDSQVNDYYALFCEQGESTDQMLSRINCWFVGATCSWAGKKADAHCGMGPYIVTADEIGNPYDLLVATLQDNVVRDRSHTAGTSIGIERTIQFYSSFATLYPGDVIHMGTLGTDGIFITEDMTFTAGNLIQASIEKIGLLSLRVLDIPNHASHPETLRADNRDWRTEDQLPVPISDAVRYYSDHGLRQFQGEWTPSQAKHVFTCFGNYPQCMEAEGMPVVPAARFLNGPNSMLAANGTDVTLAKRATSMTISVELGVVIGQLSSGLTAETAEDAILGYVPSIVLCDHSFSEMLIEPTTPQEKGICSVYGRWGDGYTIVGSPSKTLVPDAQMTLEIEGYRSIVQNTSNYSHHAREVLANITSCITLFPGDVVILGRTGKCMTLPLDAFTDGISISASIEGLGVVRSTIRCAQE